MFPAYKTQDSSAVDPQSCEEFLQNPSYDAIPVTSSTIAQQISSSSSSDSDGELKEDKFVQKYKKPTTPPPVELFYIDRERKREYLKLDYLPNRAIPFYKITRNFKRFAQSNKRFRRYFKVKRIKKLTQDPARLIDEKVSKDEEMRIFLIKNPQDVEKWLEYINYKVRRILWTC